jgi:hypothetical protein
MVPSLAAGEGPPDDRLDIQSAPPAVQATAYASTSHLDPTDYR